MALWNEEPIFNQPLTHKFIKNHKLNLIRNISKYWLCIFGDNGKKKQKLVKWKKKKNMHCTIQLPEVEGYMAQNKTYLIKETIE